MTQAAQANSLHDRGAQLLEEGRRAALAKLDSATAALAALNAGESESSLDAILQETVAPAVADAQRFKGLATGLVEDLATYRQIDELGRGAPRVTHPLVNPQEAAPAAPRTAVPEGLSADPREPVILSGRPRQMVNRYLRLMGRRVAMPAFALNQDETLSRADWDYLTSGPERETLMTPYVERDGGAVTAEEVRNEAISRIRDVTYIRSRARSIPTTSASVAFPSAKIDLTLSKTRAGRGTGSSPVTLRDVFGKQRFIPSGSAEIIKVPKELLEDATFDIIGFIAAEIAKNDLEAEEQLFLTGTGSGEPLGVLVAIDKLAAAGYTGLDVPHTGASAALFTPEDIKTMPYKMRKALRVGGVAGGASWTCERQFLQKVTVMRTDSGAGAGTGQFLFQQGLRAGDPDTLVNYVILESEFFPDKISSGSVGDPMVLFGQWGEYWIVDRKSLQITVLDQLYAETQEVGYQYEKRFDAAPVRAEAFIFMSRKA